LDALGKAASAFSNSGGGHLVLGVEDNGNFDGVPEVYSGRTTTRDWLEQKIPDLLDYKLSNFRVHTAVPAAATLIPASRQLIVIDFADSPLAPHQSRRNQTYYYRSAGRSVPAPHFYLELLRQRLTSPALEFALSNLHFEVYEHERTIFLRIDLEFTVKNVGRMAAYKWALAFRKASTASGRADDYFLDRKLPGASGGLGQLRIDDTILPGCFLLERKTIGLSLGSERGETQVRETLKTLMEEMTITAQLATETSPGLSKTIEIWPLVNVDSVVGILKSKSLIV
jgi:hypothetical protein